MNRTQKQLLFMVLIFVGVWVIFTLITYLNHDGKSDGKFLSVKNEHKTAKVVHRLIMEEFDTVNPPQSRLAIQQIFNRFEENLDSSYHYQFFIIDDEMNNAFATLNGNIYIMLGLIEFAETPEVLAAVIAHEIGHIENRDFETRLSKNISLSALEMIVTGGNTTLITELSKTLFSTKYDRQQEQASDEFARELLIKSGIHPENLAVLFLSMEREPNVDFTEGTEVFMSHPHLRNRIDDAVNYELPEDFESQPLNIDWEKVKQEMKYY